MVPEYPRATQEFRTKRQVPKRQLRSSKVERGTEKSSWASAPVPVARHGLAPRWLLGRIVLSYSGGQIFYRFDLGVRIRACVNVGKFKNRRLAVAEFYFELAGQIL